MPPPDERTHERSVDLSRHPPHSPLEQVPTRVGQNAIVTRGPDELERVNLASRYLLGEKLGAGGMGIVVEAYDPRMRRELAIKRPLPGRDDGARILAEARIQSGLEHPAIVPVYEVGRDLEGRAYFTMRRLEGTSLAEVLSDPTSARDSSVAPRWSSNRLLRAYVDVCLAVEYAHSRGVVHCDLKPGNVLFGEFGEVYVLDWGTARRYRAGPDPEIDPVSRARTAEGTPSYMAPEQFRSGETLTPAADVFALGAMLFEILVGTPLHADKATSLQIEAEYERGFLRSSPLERVPSRGISPELDWLCQAALRIDATERVSSARQLADGVQAYLDGDRDVERRRSIAAGHLREAEELLETYEAEPVHASVRAAAFSEAARALSYDPTHEGARDMVTRLLFDPPTEIPAEVLAEVEREEAELAVRQAELVIGAYVALLAFLPLFLIGGVRSVGLTFGVVGLTFLLIANAIDLRSRRAIPAWRFALRVLGDATLVGLLATVFGPISMPPALAVMAAMLYAGSPGIKHPYVLVFANMLAPTVPLALAWCGLWNSMEITADRIVVHATIASFHPLYTWFGLAAFVPALVGVASLIRGKTIQASHEATLRHALQRWHLSQVVGVGVGSRASARSDDDTTRTRLT